MSTKTLTHEQFLEKTRRNLKRANTLTRFEGGEEGWRAHQQYEKARHIVNKLEEIDTKMKGLKK